MNKAIPVLAFLALPLLSSCTSQAHNDDEICDIFTWTVIENLSMPYLDDAEYQELVVMQGPGFNYNPSLLADNVYKDSMHPEVKRILKRVINANCQTTDSQVL